MLKIEGKTFIECTSMYVLFVLYINNNNNNRTFKGGVEDNKLTSESFKLKMINTFPI